MLWILSPTRRKIFFTNDILLFSDACLQINRRDRIGIVGRNGAGELQDSCLWMKLAQATGAPGNSTALVGAPDTVAKALVEYYKLGATSLLIRGYDPLPDAQQYGAELIPLVRKLIAEADAAI